MTNQQPGPPDLRERGRSRDGTPIYSTRRLYMQLQLFGGCTDSMPLIAALETAAIPGTLYENLNDARTVALLTFSEEPDFFMTDLRRLINQPPFIELAIQPEFTMFGRTYSLGYEPNLDDLLVNRPIRRVTDPDMPWAIWYPLRRSGEFVQLDATAQRDILMEHGTVGRSFGSAGLGTDIRLACHGLDKNDNDFVIGLIGPELHPLSAIVQSMRKTRQTSRYLESLGPFFIGKAVWQKGGFQ